MSRLFAGKGMVFRIRTWLTSTKSASCSCGRLAERSLINPRCLSVPSLAASAGTFPSSIPNEHRLVSITPHTTYNYIYTYYILYIYVYICMYNTYIHTHNIRRSFGKSKSTVWSSYFLNTTWELYTSLLDLYHIWVRACIVPIRRISYFSPLSIPLTPLVPRRTAEIIFSSLRFTHFFFSLLFLFLSWTHLNTFFSDHTLFFFFSFSFHFERNSIVLPSSQWTVANHFRQHLFFFSYY